MSFIISIGKYGGFYVKAGRVCLGWIAFSFIPFDVDDVLEAGLTALEQ